MAVLWQVMTATATHRAVYHLNENVKDERRVIVEKTIDEEMIPTIHLTKSPKDTTVMTIAGRERRRNTNIVIGARRVDIELVDSHACILV